VLSIPGSFILWIWQSPLWVIFFINNWIVLFVDLTVTYTSEYLYRQLDCVDNTCLSRGRRGHDRTLVGFTITCAISAYHHWGWDEFESHSGEVYSIQHYVIKFVSDLGQVSGFLWGTPVSSINKTDCHDITEILLKVALNTITLTLFI